MNTSLPKCPWDTFKLLGVVSFSARSWQYLRYQTLFFSDTSDTDPFMFIILTFEWELEFQRLALNLSSVIFRGVILSHLLMSVLFSSE